MNELMVRPLDALAQRINEEQHQIEHHAKGMLLAAKAAGEALIEAKKMLAHGQFKQWVEVNTRVSYNTAREYMLVAKRANLTDLRQFDGGIRAFLDATRETTKNTSTASNLPTFTEDDAEYALKIAARMDSEFEGEREVAKTKLEKLAKDHGMTSGELLEKAKAMCAAPVPLSPLEEGIKNLMKPYEQLSKQRLLGLLLKAFATHPDLIDVFSEDF